MNQFHPSEINRTTLFQRVALLVISMVIGLTLAECVVRKLDLVPELATNLGNIRFVENQRMVYEFVPGSAWGEYRMNEQGFFDSDFNLIKPKDVLRIAMLGDSITQGGHLPPSNNFSKKLENLLNQRSHAKKFPRRYEVMNFGVGGYNLGAEVETLKQKVLPYKPDIVVLNLFFNDADPMPGIDMWLVSNYYHLSEDQKTAVIQKYIDNRNSIFRQGERNLLSKSKLYVFLKINMLRKRNKQAPADVRTYPRKDMARVRELFKEIDLLQKKHRFKFLICIHPGLLYYESPNNAEFASLAASFKFDHFYMRPYYQKANIPPKALQLKDFPHDTCHPNELGNILIAEAIFNELKKNNLIEPEL